LRTAATASSAAARRRSPAAATRSPIRPAGAQRDLQLRVLRSVRRYRAGKKSDGTDLPCEGSDATCGAPWTAVYLNGFANYPGSNNGGTIDLTTGYPIRSGA
jgi:hypothetical protein